MSKSVVKQSEIYFNFINNMNRLKYFLYIMNDLTRNARKNTDAIIKKMIYVKTNKDIKLQPKEGEIQFQFTEKELEVLIDVMKDGDEKLISLMPFFRKQILIFAVSLYELYLMDLIYNYHSKYPLFLKNSDKTLSYKEIFEFQLLDEISEKVIMKEIEKVGFMTYNDMIKYVKEILNLKLNNLVILNNRMNEIIEIRNIIIHNNSIINERFMKKINNNRYRIGEKLEIDDILLNESLTTILDTATLIDKEAKKKLFSNTTTFSMYHNE